MSKQEVQLSPEKDQQIMELSSLEGKHNCTSHMFNYMIYSITH